MKKNISLGLLVLLSVLLTNFGQVILRADIGGQKGFLFDESKYFVQFYDYQTYTVKTEGGGEIGYLSYLAGLARRKGTNTYVFMMKECMTPSENRVRVRKENDHNPISERPFSGWGVSEYMIVDTYLTNLDEWEPRNKPKTRKITLSVGGAKGADPGVGTSVGFSYEIDLKEMKIKPKAYQTSGHYTVDYDYVPHTFWGDNAYFSDSSNHYQVAEFSTTGKTVEIDVNYEARFGVATTESRMPTSVYTSAVWKKTGTRRYKYTLPRNSYTPTKKALDFVERAYKNFMNRTPDRSGWNYWALDLTNGDVSAASIIYQFYYSEEFGNLKVSDEELVRRLYVTCLDRKPDDGGMLYWVKEIQSKKKTRDQVVKDFIYSEEFSNVCARYGFVRGTV